VKPAVPSWHDTSAMVTMHMMCTRCDNIKKTPKHQARCCDAANEAAINGPQAPSPVHERQETQLAMHTCGY
jgi:hypothetical protein